MLPTLVIMIKLPRPGRVKTRLGRDIGAVAATWWFRHQTRRLLKRLEDPRWQLVLAVAPDVAGMMTPVWPRHLARIPQGRGDLGQRMRRAIVNTAPGPVIVVGADIPDITRRHIARAFAALGSAESVLGPAPDGGYWLVGLRHPARAPRALFRDVRWSTSHAMQDTLPTLPKPVAMVDSLSDVDTAADLTNRT